ncbi:glycosyltransferase [Tropicimonas marinistellae]|uniref:glycosyltransferase n=1 Tax=Tropicimonas marinistellae TaxID=1739787 RepID=UPI0013723373|nr:glycosyltransferase [Tropicimonas marinistellae]
MDKVDEYPGNPAVPQSASPDATIGIPVFNGENYLEEAIKSALCQTADDLELVVCDNASTDRTAEIVKDHAADDPRITYLRNETNIGAARNYNRVWAEGRGRYFKWLAHDDRMKPEYLERTIPVLDARPEVVLCNSRVDYIDADGTVFDQYDGILSEASHARPSDRFAAIVLKSHSCVDFFGLLRRDAMENSLRHGTFHGADRAFLAQMALRGEFAHIRDPLVEMREHPNRYTRQNISVQARQTWHDGDRGRRFEVPSLILYRKYREIVAQEASLTPEERRRCNQVLTQWWFTNWNAVRVAVDGVSNVIPGFSTFAENAKVRLFGAAPGHFTKR